MRIFSKTIVALTLAATLNFLSVMAFYDVPSNHKFETSIESLADKGIIQGYYDGSFQPEKSISRSEAVKILVGSIKPRDIIDAVESEIQSNSFETGYFDVQPMDWFAPYVALSTQGGIVNGYNDGTFRPGNTIALAEGIKIILGAYNIDVSNTSFDYRPLVLMDESDWAAPYVGYAFDHNLIDREKFYYPSQPMTRGEFAELLYRTQNLGEKGWDSYPKTFVDSDEYTITIPKLNIYSLNVSFADPYDHDGSLNVLKNGLGHYLSPPGSGHKMVLFGHSSGYDWDDSPFKTILTQIDKLQPGDMIYTNYREKGYIYQISHTEVRPANDMVAVMEDTNSEVMALYTCWPPKSIAKRYVVYAEPYNF